MLSEAIKLLEEKIKEDSCEIPECNCQDTEWHKKAKELIKEYKDSMIH